MQAECTSHAGLRRYTAYEAPDSSGSWNCLGYVRTTYEITLRRRPASSTAIMSLRAEQGRGPQPLLRHVVYPDLFPSTS